MSHTPLDSIDRRILFELDRDSRQSVAALARKFRLGRDRVTYRIARLKERGILQRCAALVDPYRLGFSFCKTYFKLNAINSRRAALEKKLRSHPRTYWLAECDGAWDMIWCILAKDALEFRRFQGEIFSRFGSLIVDFDVSMNVEVDAFYKNFLQASGNGGRRLGGDVQRTDLSTFDTRLLRLVTEDSRMDYETMAERLNANVLTVKKHLRALEENRVLAGFRVDIDLASIGMTFFKAQIYTNSFTQHDEERLRTYCDNHPNITHYIRQVGKCMIELEIDATDYPHFNSIIREIREKHSSFVRNTETILVRREHYQWPL